jgi:hypothetical protein
VHQAAWLTDVTNTWGGTIPPLPDGVTAAVRADSQATCPASRALLQRLAVLLR